MGLDYYGKLGILVRSNYYYISRGGILIFNRFDFYLSEEKR